MSKVQFLGSTHQGDSVFFSCTVSVALLDLILGTPHHVRGVYLNRFVVNCWRETSTLCQNLPFTFMRCTAETATILLMPFVTS